MSKIDTGIIEARGNNRSKIVAIGSRGKLPTDVVLAVNLDDETLLDDVRRAAKDALLAQGTLTEAVSACCEADIERDEVITAIIEAGFAEPTARSIVCVVYGQAGKTVNKRGQGRETPRAAIGFAEYALGKCDCRATAIKMLRAAGRHLEREGKAEAAKVARAAKAKSVAPDPVSSPVQTSLQTSEVA